MNEQIVNNKYKEVASFYTIDEALSRIAGFGSKSEKKEKIVLYRREFDYDNILLKDHTVLGVRMLMGVVHCSIAVDAALQKFPDKKLSKMRRISFLDAIKCFSGENIAVEVEISENDNQVFFNNYYSINKDFVKKTSEGMLVFDNFSETGFENETLDKVKFSEDQFISILDYYKNSDVYGPGFYTVQNICYTEEGIIGRVRLQESILNGATDFTVHPALLDACCVTSLFAAPDHFGKDACVPLYINEISFYDKLPDNCYCWSRIERKSREILVSRNVFFDENKNVFMVIDGLNLKRVSSLESIGINNGSKNKLSFAETQDAPKKPELKPEKNEMITTKETISRTSTLEKNVKEYLETKIKSIIKKGPDSIQIETNFMDLGLDSQDLLKLSPAIESELGIELYPTLFFEYQNIKELTTWFSKTHAGKLRQFFKLKDEEVATISTSSDVETQVKSSNGDKKQHGFTSEYILQDTGYKQPKSDQFPPIAIIGIAGVMPQSEDLDEYWDNLIAGKDCVTEIPSDRWDWKEIYGDPQIEINKTNAKWGGFMKDVDKFDAPFFGINSREAGMMDPQQRLMIEVSYKCIEDAGYKVSDFAKTRTGFFVGVSSFDYFDLMRTHNLPIEAYSTTGISHCILPNRVSFLLNLNGPSEPVDTACSSSLIAVHRAIRAIQGGDCDTAIAGGVNVMVSPTVFISFSKAGMLSPHGRCKTFDKSANGYVRGEGGGAILLKSLDKAISDGDHIYGIFAGSNVNHGGRANTLTAPNATLQAKLIEDTLIKEDIDPSSISYIECHGTGTELGDPIEINALKNAFNSVSEIRSLNKNSKAYCGLGSVKTSIGHLEAGAGIAGILKILLSLKHQILPGNIHLKDLNPLIKLEGTPFYTIRENQHWDAVTNMNGKILPRRAGISSFGFGGANCHMIIQEYQGSMHEQSTIKILTPFIFVLSAKNEERLREYAGKIVKFLERTENKEKINNMQFFADIIYTLQIGRDAMTERIAIISDGPEDLKYSLKKYLENAEQNIEEIYKGNSVSDKLKVEFLLNSKAGYEYQKILIREKEYNHLAKLWVAGVDIKWQELYNDEYYKPKRISLPTYPFARIRYWLPEEYGATFSSQTFKTPQEISPVDSEEKLVTESEKIITNSDSSVTGFLKMRLSEKLNVPAESIDPEADFYETGVDSITSMELIREIESEYGLKMYVSEFRDNNTLSKLSEYIEKEIEIIQKRKEVLDIKSEVKNVKDKNPDSKAAIELTKNNYKSLVNKSLNVPKNSSHETKPLVFVFSTPRAGSTLFRVMLMGHSRLFSPPELMLLPYNNISEWSEDLKRKNWDHFKDGFIESLKTLENISVEEAVEKVNKMAEDKIPIKDAYNILQQTIGENYLIDKTPPYALDINILRKAEQMGRSPLYIHLYRHPLSVMGSIVKSRFDRMMNIKNENTWELADQAWFLMNYNIKTFLKTISTDRYISIQYETMVEHPEKIMRQVCNFLNIGYEESMIQPYQGERMINGLHEGRSMSVGDPNFLTHSSIDSQLAHKWKKDASKVVEMSKESISLAEELGYSFDNLPGIDFDASKVTKRIGKIYDVFVSEANKTACDLSIPQKSIFKRMGENPLWGIVNTFSVELPEETDKIVFNNALSKLLRKHPILRRSFIKEGDRIVQYENPLTIPELLYFELIGKSNEEMSQIILDREMLLKEEINISEAPLFRIAVYKYSLTKYKILILVHMLITDGITNSIITKDLLDLIKNPEKTVEESGKYQHFINECNNKLNSEILENDLKFWRPHSTEKLVYPVDRKRGKNIVKTEKILVASHTFADLGIDYKSGKMELFFPYAVGLFLHISKCTGNSNPVIGFRLNRRNLFNENYYDVAGRFAGEVPLRMKIKDGTTAMEYLSSFRRSFKEIPYNGITYELLVQQGKVLPVNLLSPFILNYQPATLFNPLKESESKIHAHQFECEDNIRFYQIDMIVRGYDDRVDTIVKYSSGQYKETTISQFVDGWVGCVKQIISEIVDVKEKSE